jgi:2-polyprenyl-3-methyl-5-hydroxy-6-metoxy-1,4-benzoquinol methylase
MEPICPVCNSKQSQVFHKLSQGTLVRCHRCKVVFYTPMPTLEELAAYYDSITYREEYASYEMTGGDFSQARYQQLLAQLNQPKFEVKLSAKFEGESRKLLDVGCGTGDFLQVASQHGWQVEGVEISEKAAQAAIAKLNSPVRVGEVTTIDFQSEKYDLITSYHVIEHLLDPVSTLRKMGELLSEQGILFIETPNIGSLGARLRGRKWSHIIPPEHIVYFDAASLKFALEQAGFQTVYTFSSAPYLIKSLTQFPNWVQRLGRMVYQLAPMLGMGAALQAIAFNPQPRH